MAVSQFSEGPRKISQDVAGCQAETDQLYVYKAVHWRGHGIFFSAINELAFRTKSQLEFYFCFPN